MVRVDSFLTVELSLVELLSLSPIADHNSVEWCGGRPPRVEQGLPLVRKKSGREDRVSNNCVCGCFIPRKLETAWSLFSTSHHSHRLELSLPASSFFFAWVVESANSQASGGGRAQGSSHCCCNSLTRPWPWQIELRGFCKVRGKWSIESRAEQREQVLELSSVCVTK